MSAGCWPFPASAGSDSGWKRHPRLPFSHGLNPGGVSELQRPFKRLLEPRAWWRRGGFLAAAVLRFTSESPGSASPLTLKGWEQVFWPWRVITVSFLAVLNVNTMIFGCESSSFRPSCLLFFNLFINLQTTTMQYVREKKMATEVNFNVDENETTYVTK